MAASATTSRALSSVTSLSTVSERSLSSSQSIAGCRLCWPPASRSFTQVRSLKVTASASRADAASREEVLRPFVQRKAFKVIAGLKNFDSKSVAEIVAAAEQGGATHVDIACDPELVKLACSITKIPVCVSAVDPELFVPAVAAGATMAEIGNYDPFYAEGRVFDASEVLALTKRTRALLPHIPLSVTVPHTLPLPDQVHLAELLEKAGADIIQTEGGVSSAPTQAGVAGMIEKASPTLAAAYSISRAVSIPVMCASGISDVTASMAIAAGAAGVGVGSAINKLNSGIAMIAATRAIANALRLVSHRGVHRKVTAAKLSAIEKLN